jgi:putative hydrolase of the HAD superfamily
MFDLIAFDADDTLWHTEGLYSDAQARFKALLERYISHDTVEEKLFETEMRNVPVFGYGIKGFTLSMIETAIELTEGRITGRDIQQVIDLAKNMFNAEVRPLDHVQATLEALSKSHRLMIVTKGDLFDQESKIARSGLASYFRHVEIVSDKTPDSYAALLARYMAPPERFMMVGNSLRSDVLPVLRLGGTAVYIPYAITWAHEMVSEVPAGLPAWHELGSLQELPALVARLEAKPGAQHG